MRMHAEFDQSGDICGQMLFVFQLFSFSGCAALEIVFRGIWHALAVILDTDRGRYIPETHW